MSLKVTQRHKVIGNDTIQSLSISNL